MQYIREAGSPERRALNETEFYTYWTDKMINGQQEIKAENAQKGNADDVAPLQRLPENGDFVAPLQYIKDLINGTSAEKAAFINRLQDQTVKNENVVALCIALVYMYDFQADFQYIEWCRENLGLKDSSDICNRRRVGVMLNNMKDDVELFRFLMSVPYRKNIVLVRVCNHDDFKKFIRTKQREIKELQREALAETRNHYFKLTQNNEEKAEQLTFDFSSVEKTVFNAAKSENIIQKVAKKITSAKAIPFFMGSVNLAAAAVTFWEEHPEARPENLAEYWRGANELVQALDSLLNGMEK